MGANVRTGRIKTAVWGRIQDAADRRAGQDSGHPFSASPAYVFVELYFIDPLANHVIMGARKKAEMVRGTKSDMITSKVLLAKMATGPAM
jgi:hypothetical protein